MIVKVIVRRALKAERFYLPGETLFPPFSPGIMAEVRAGRGMVDVYSVSDEKLGPSDESDETLKTVVIKLSGREILFRKFEPMESGTKLVVAPRPRSWTAPRWFTGRHAKKNKQLLFRKFQLEG
jgi:hypothetical protein